MVEGSPGFFINVVKYRPLGKFLGFPARAQVYAPRSVHKSLEVLDMLFVGLVYVTALEQLLRLRSSPIRSKKI